MASGLSRAEQLARQALKIAAENAKKAAEEQRKKAFHLPKAKGGRTPAQRQADILKRRPPAQNRAGTSAGIGPFSVRKYPQQALEKNRERVRQSFRTPGTGTGVSGANRVDLSEQLGGTRQPNGAGIEIVLGTVNRVPHTYTTADGKFCNTDLWFTHCGLCYDAGKKDKSRGGLYDPMLFLEGPKFRCYYPASTAADFKGVMQSRSAGRWLHAWGQKRNYVSF